MVSAQKFDKNQNVTILAWNIPILYMVFTQKIGSGAEVRG